MSPKLGPQHKLTHVFDSKNPSTTYPNPNLTKLKLHLIPTLEKPQYHPANTTTIHTCKHPSPSIKETKSHHRLHKIPLTCTTTQSGPIPYSNCKAIHACRFAMNRHELHHSKQKHIAQCYHLAAKTPSKPTPTMRMQQPWLRNLKTNPKDRKSVV